MFFPSSTIGAEHKTTSSILKVGGRLIAGLLYLTLISCSVLPAGRMPQSPEDPVKAIVESVPFFAQEELQCGPASLAMLLNWSGRDLQPADLTEEVYIPELKGSLQSSMISATRLHNRIAYPITGSEALLAELAAGNPVIVLVNLSFFWYPKWHYAVAIGYDQQQGHVILHSGLNPGEVLNSRVFMNIWKRSNYWGLLVLPPDRLPAGAREKEWLAAVAGLEGAGKWQAAVTGYVTALKRWKESFAAWMGLGNSYFNLNKLDESAKAFHQAARFQPNNGMAFNNLAHVLAEQEKWEEAQTAAQRAVELGGPFLDVFRKTLKEINRKMGST